MQLVNKSRYPLDDVRELVRFAMRGVVTAGLAVHVSNAREVAHRFAERRGWHADGPSIVTRLWGGRFA
jgi:hypothetical protein